MTRHLRSSSPRAAEPLLRPLPPSRSLTDEVVDRIATGIRDGKLAPGAQLPTESELMAAMNVSRTVVREAVAALKANGLVVTRQGLGAFVATDASRLAFRMATGETSGADAITEILRVMELRLAVEVEAVGLAAERATRPQVAEIREALHAIDRAIGAGGNAVQEDFAFHRAIAEATANPHFADFLAFLGRHVIPRQVIRASVFSRDEHLAYLALIQKDHVRIFEAIRAGDAGAARRAMRGHLARSMERYRGLAERLG